MRRTNVFNGLFKTQAVSPFDRSTLTQFKSSPQPIELRRRSWDRTGLAAPPRSRAVEKDSRNSPGA